jgi:hypothetical protein
MLRRTIRAEHHSLAINTHGNCWRCNTSVIRDDELITFLKRTIFLCESEAVGILLARMAILCEYEVCVLLLLHTRSAGASFGVTSRRDLKVVEQRALSLKSRTGNEFRCYLPELDLNTTRVKDWRWSRRRPKHILKVPCGMVSGNPFLVQRNSFLTPSINASELVMMNAFLILGWSWAISRIALQPIK